MQSLTTQDELDFYYLIRNIQWRYRLDLVEDEVIARVKTLLDEMRAELSGLLLSYKPEQFTAQRITMLLEEIEIYSAAVQAQTIDMISGAAGLAGQYSLQEQYDILSLGKKAGNIQAFSLGGTDFSALFLANPLGGKSLQAWVNKAFGEGQQVITSAIQKGMFQGEGYSKIVSSILGESSDITLREATTLARTYVHSASVSAQEAVYEANKDIVGRVKWSAVLEPGFLKTGRGTCLRCSALDQVTWAFGEERPECPLHPRCRCLLLPVIDWEKIGIPELELRETIRPYTVRPDKNIDAGARRTILEVGQHKGSYADWFAGRDEKFQQNVLGPERHKLYRQGVDFNNFVNSRTGALYTLEELAGKI